MATQRSLSAEKNIQVLMTLLRSGQTTEALMGELMLELSHELTVSLKKFVDYGPDELAGLMAPLANDLMRVHHQPGMRRVEICGASTIFHVRTRDTEREVLAGAARLFGGESAVAMWSLSGGRLRHTEKWQIFSASQWHIMLLEWLVTHLQGWIEKIDANRVPGVSPDAIAREVARITASKIPAYGVLLDVLLLDALGYPRSLVAYHLRLGLRYQLLVSADWETSLIEFWSDIRYWPGRSGKLFPIAVSTASMMCGGALTPANVRDVLVTSGLSRNAWAHLARLPAATLHVLCLALERFSDADGKRIFLDELSFWLARFGRGVRYYRIPLANLTVALVWLVSESVDVRGRHSAAVNQARRPGSSLLPENLYWHESLISRMELSASHHDRLRLLLLAFAREVLAQSDELPALFSQLSEVMDWFRAEGLRLPPGWYKQSWSVMRSRGDQWHAEIIRQQEVRAREEAQVREAENEQRRAQFLLDVPAAFKSGVGEVSWTTPLPRYQAGDLVLEALLDSQALRQEGLLMSHCVGSYSQACLERRSLIYAVTHAEQRLGTLEMYAASPSDWRVVQFKGKRNCDLMHFIVQNGTFFRHFQAFKQAFHSALREQSLQIVRKTIAKKEEE